MGRRKACHNFVKKWFFLSIKHPMENIDVPSIENSADENIQNSYVMSSPVTAKRPGSFRVHDSEIDRCRTSCRSALQDPSAGEAHLYDARRSHHCSEAPVARHMVVGNLSGWKPVQESKDNHAYWITSGVLFLPVTLLYTSLYLLKTYILVGASFMYTPDCFFQTQPTFPSPIFPLPAQSIHPSPAQKAGRKPPLPILQPLSNI